MEITSINQMYLEEESLELINLGRGMAWLDTGTQDALLEASNFVKTIQSRQGIMVACLEEIAYRNGWIDRNQIQDMAESLSKTKYGEYLLELLRESERCQNIKNRNKSKRAIYCHFSFLSGFSWIFSEMYHKRNL